MAHHVARELKQRPNDILDGWGVAELVVAYGQYTNEDAYSNFLQWKSMDGKAKKSVKKPDAFHVKFFGLEELEVVEDD